MNVKALREALSDYPDDTPIAVYDAEWDICNEIELPHLMLKTRYSHWGYYATTDARLNSISDDEKATKEVLVLLP